MKKFVVVVALLAAFALSFASIGGVSAADHSVPGTPGTSNCHGQTMAFLAQVGQGAGLQGIGNIADANNLTVQQVQDIVTAYCGS